MSFFQGHSLSGLRPIRELLHHRPTDLARSIGVGLASYSRYERGERRIYFDKALMLARILQVPVEWLASEPDDNRRRELFAKGELRLKVMKDVAEALAETDETTMTRMQPTPATNTDDDPAWQQLLKDFGEPEN